MKKINKINLKITCYNNMKMNALIFGEKGSIGDYIYNSFKKENINKIGATTNHII